MRMTGSRVTRLLIRAAEARVALARIPNRAQPAALVSQELAFKIQNARIPIPALKEVLVLKELANKIPNVRLPIPAQMASRVSQEFASKILLPPQLAAMSK